MQIHKAFLRYRNQGTSIIDLSELSLHNPSHLGARNCDVSLCSEDVAACWKHSFCNVEDTSGIVSDMTTKNILWPFQMVDCVGTKNRTEAHLHG